MRYENAVLVGVDANKPDRSLLGWAAEEALARDARLVVCHLWEWSEIDRPPLSLTEQAPRESRNGPERLVDDAVQAVRGWYPDLPVSGALGHGRPTPGLLEASDGAGMLVVGARGTGGFAGLLLGSVSAQVAAHARCPVAVVRRPAREDAADVVAGVDGSAHSDEALRLAVAEARRFGGNLVALHGYRLPPPAEYGPNAGIDEPHHRAAAEDVLDRAVARLGTGASDVKIERRAVHGAPARSLLEAAADAAVLVVGARGLGIFAGLVLGSVSQQVVRHAPCPVLVAR